MKRTKLSELKTALAAAEAGEVNIKRLNCSKQLYKDYMMLIADKYDNIIKDA